MTSIIGIRCVDGVVLASDSSATFGNGHLSTIEQPTDRKIEIVGNKLIVAGTGYVGHQQRFVNVVEKLFADKQFSGKDPHQIAKLLAKKGLEEFGSTHVLHLEYTALVAYEANGVPTLCELPSGPMTANQQPTAFQPELKDVNDHLWFVSAGSGQSITDPLLSYFRNVFWADGPPKIQGGVFTALWALQHACDVNPGGIKEPIHVAVLTSKKGIYTAKKMSQDELAEAKDMVNDATKYIGRYKDVVLGNLGTSELPVPPKN